MDLRDFAKFNVMWKSYTKVLLESTSKLLVTGQFADVTLACEGQKIKCHRIVLSTFSSHLAQVLADISTPEPVIYLASGIKFNHLQALVGFMYNGAMEIAQEDIPGILNAAEELKIRGLSIPPNNEKPNSMEQTTSDTDDASENHTSGGTDRTTIVSNDVTSRSNTSSNCSGNGNSLMAPLNTPETTVQNEIGDCGREAEAGTDEELDKSNDDDGGGSSGQETNVKETHPIPNESMKQDHSIEKTKARKSHPRKSTTAYVPTTAELGGSPATTHIRKKRNRRPRARKSPPQPSPFGENMKKAIEMVATGGGLSRASKEFRIPISTLSKYSKDPERLKSSKLYFFP